LLTLPALIAGTMMSKRIRVALAAPAVAYICLLTRNRIKLGVARPVNALVEQEIERRERDR